MSKTILVQDPDVLISLDLAQTVMEAWPDASVILCRDVMQVLGILSEGKRPNLLILRQSLRSIRGFGLVSLLHDPQMQVILTQADDNEGQAITDLGWRTLDMPFFAAQVRDTLHDAFPQREPGMERHCNQSGFG